MHLAQNVKQDPPNAQTAATANSVIRAMKNVVVYSTHGQARPHANGLSIFFPSEKEELTKTQGKADYLKTAFSLSGKWLPFLNEYTGAEAEDTEAPGLEDVKADDGDVETGEV